MCSSITSCRFSLYFNLKKTGVYEVTKNGFCLKSICQNNFFVLFNDIRNISKNFDTAKSSIVEHISNMTIRKKRIWNQRKKESKNSRQCLFILVINYQSSLSFLLKIYYYFNTAWSPALRDGFGWKEYLTFSFGATAR